MRVLLTIVFLAYGLLALSLRGGAMPNVRVENAAAVPIASVWIEVDDQAEILTDVAATRVELRQLPLTKAGVLRVWVQFDDGRRLSARGGYFVPGMAGLNQLAIVTPDSMTVETR